MSTKSLTVMPLRRYYWCIFGCPHPGLTFIGVEDAFVLIYKNWLFFLSQHLVAVHVASLSPLHGASGRRVSFNSFGFLQASD